MGRGRSSQVQGEVDDRDRKVLKTLGVKARGQTGFHLESSFCQAIGGSWTKVARSCIRMEKGG